MGVAVLVETQHRRLHRRARCSLFGSRPLGDLIDVSRLAVSGLRSRAALRPWRTCEARLRRLRALSPEARRDMGGRLV